jgi:hypothetical protein
MVVRFIIVALVVALFGAPVVAPAGPALAQPLRTMVVPADEPLVVAPRGQVVPRAPTPVRAAPAPTAPPSAPSSVAQPAVVPPPAVVLPAGPGLGAFLPALLPIAGAVLLGAGTPGSGNATGAPASTR